MPAGPAVAAQPSAAVEPQPAAVSPVPEPAETAVAAVLYAQAPVEPEAVALSQRAFVVEPILAFVFALAAADFEPAVCDALVAVAISPAVVVQRDESLVAARVVSAAEVAS